MDQGSEDFEAVVRDHWVPVYRYLMHQAGNAHDAEELTQETFLRAWKNWPKSEFELRPRAWLITIARNAFLDLARRRTKVKVGAIHDDDAVGSYEPDSAVELGDQAKLVRNALKDLTELARSVFLMRVEGEMSFAEVAATLKISEDAARWHMGQARQKLMAKIGDKDG